MKIVIEPSGEYEGWWFIMQPFASPDNVHPLAMVKVIRHILTDNRKLFRRDIGAEGKEV